MRYLIICICLVLTVSCKQDKLPKDSLGLSSKLSGKWIAEAFDGELHETWILGEDGWMLQEGYYIEANDTSYSANTKIEKVNEATVLFSVIKGATPKIFQASTISATKMVFENKDYKNPSEVIYEFIDSDNYKRTINGYENDSLVSYVFHFKKQ